MCVRVCACVCVCVCVGVWVWVWVWVWVCVCLRINNNVILIVLCSYFQTGVVDSNGYTPLGLAVQNGMLEVVNYLITEQNIDPKGTYR